MQGYDLAAFTGTLVRIVLFAAIGALYACLMPLPAEKWTAIERGVMAPVIVAALIINNGFDSKKLDQASAAAFKIEIVSTANAQAQPKPADTKPTSQPQPESSSFRRFIRGLTGK